MKQAYFNEDGLLCVPTSKGLYTFQAPKVKHLRELEAAADKGQLAMAMQLISKLSVKPALLLSDVEEMDLTIFKEVSEGFKLFQLNNEVE